MFLKGTKPKTKHVMQFKRNTNSLIKLDQSSHFEAHVSDLTNRRKLPTARGRKCPNCQVFQLFQVPTTIATTTSGLISNPGSFQASSLFAKTKALVQKWQTEDYSPGWFTDFVRIRDLVLPWQQLHERAGTCQQNCPQCEPRRGKLVTWTPRSSSFWARRVQSWRIFWEFGGGAKVGNVLFTFRIQHRWCPYRRETRTRAGTPIHQRLTRSS